MTENFSFSMDTNQNFSFDLYENVPIGEHTATIKDIIVENDKATRYGVKDRYTVVFYLHELDQEFYYYFSKSSYENSKYFSFFKMICEALGKNKINQEIKGQTFAINISLEPYFKDLDKMVTRITNIKKVESEGNNIEQ